MDLRQLILIALTALWFGISSWVALPAAAMAESLTHAHHHIPEDPTVPAVFPFNTEAEDFFNKGLDCLYVNDYEGAVDAFSQSLSLASGYRVYLQRGQVYAQLGRWTQAITDYTQALNISAVDDFHAHFLRGMAFEAIGEFEAAIADYTDTINIYPTDGIGYARRGIVYSQLGQILPAHRDFEAALKQNAGRPEAYLGRGNLRLKLGNPIGAMRDYQTAVTLFTEQGHPTDAQAIARQIEQLEAQS
ncbi:MAG: tetratricopeptide repeat protein [Cyanobacteria bacterium]|nr:tetratricopeptide repeat protein [Cyanobacteriota bacterium]